jgi:hypothetical protein
MAIALDCALFDSRQERTYIPIGSCAIANRRLFEDTFSARETIAPFTLINLAFSRTPPAVPVSDTSFPLIFSITFEDKPENPTRSSTTPVEALVSIHMFGQPK